MGFLNRYRIYLIIEIFVTIAVMSSFKIIADKDWASLVASFFFVVSTISIFTFEYLKKKTFKSFTIIGALIFFVFSVLPILGLKVYYWKSMPFAAVEFAGLTGQQWHKLSNNLFFLFLLLIIIDSILDRKKQFKPQP